MENALLLSILSGFSSPDVGAISVVGGTGSKEPLAIPRIDIPGSTRSFFGRRGGVALGNVGVRIGTDFLPEVARVPSKLGDGLER